MRCPFCQEDNNKVIGNDFQYNQIHKDYKRYRVCKSCGKRFATHEFWIQAPYTFVTEQKKRRNTDELCSDDH